ncbi:hypothetical protein EDEG_03677 [Edhazardia aedis USNM 41457]|uniref:SAC3/GANP/THP3 conserved domain-containing protein n=1 Tax=Edhazardia aedis (strain USNM 41457) TaxID=1003232 RepID=J8ZQ77_EDHAE|nr:hypothetical protein EDEG_03677 [Edhazardia aedis USNM 41457]|eukprot:EJW01848.1 hypothetical protein EDEG_03677 [Edhazardia aedis USNM 41457]
MNFQEEYENLLSQRQQRTEPNGTLIGVCESFCPYFEAVERQLRNNISKFEVILIKKYQRSSAGKLKSFPEDVRPLSVLIKTVDHLLSMLNPSKATQIFSKTNFKNNFLNLFDAENTDFLHELYKFIDDRLRAVRLDLTVQDLFCQQTTFILERICRFYIIFNYFLYNNKDFEIYLNFDQLRRTLADLIHCYSKQEKSNPIFEEYYILVNINDLEMINFQSIRGKSKAFDMFIAFEQNNYVKYFEIYKSLDFLSKSICLVNNYNFMLRLLNNMKYAINDKVPLKFFENRFLLGKVELEGLLERCGIDFDDSTAFLNKFDYFAKESLVARKLSKRYRIHQSLVEVFINHGAIDIFINKEVCKNYIKKLIEAKDINGKRLTQSANGIDPKNNLLSDGLSTDNTKDVYYNKNVNNNYDTKNSIKGSLIHDLYSSKSINILPQKLKNVKTSLNDSEVKSKHGSVSFLNESMQKNDFNNDLTKSSKLFNNFSDINKKMLHNEFFENKNIFPYQKKLFDSPKNIPQNEITTFFSDNSSFEEKNNLESAFSNIYDDFLDDKKSKNIYLPDKDKNMNDITSKILENNISHLRKVESKNISIKYTLNEILKDLIHTKYLDLISFNLIKPHIKSFLLKMKRIIKPKPEVLIIFDKPKDFENLEPLLERLYHVNITAKNLKTVNMKANKTLNFSNYNLMILLSTAQSVRKIFKEKYKFVTFDYEDFAKKLNDLRFIDSIYSSKLLVKTKLSSLLQGKSFQNKIDILINLLRNKLNGSDIEKSLLNLQKNKNIIDCDVSYYKDDLHFLLNKSEK